MKKLLQHHLNSMHVYCLLIRIGINRKHAMMTARKWEKAVHGIIY